MPNEDLRRVAKSGAFEWPWSATRGLAIVTGAAGGGGGGGGALCIQGLTLHGSGGGGGGGSGFSVGGKGIDESVIFVPIFAPGENV